MRALVGALLLVGCADVGAPPELAGDDASSPAGSEDAGATSSGSDGAPGRDGPERSPRLPVAVADRYRAVASTLLEVAADAGVLANDVAGARVVTHEATTAAGGALSIDDDGALRYVPPPDFGGCDRAGYTIADDIGRTANAEIVLTVAHTRLRPSPMAIAELQREGESLALLGELAADAVGTAVALVGDVDGDGEGDVLLGAPEHAAGTGRAYVVLGSSRLGTLGLETIAAGEGGFAIDGDAPEARTAEVVAAAGDVDGDGLADLLIGAPQHNLDNGPMGDNVGRAFVVFGRDDVTAIELASLVADGAGQSFTGEAMGDAAGGALAGVGDVDGDGRDDFLLGAPLAGVGESRPGRSYLVLGLALAGSWRLDQRVAQGTAFAFEGEAQQDRSGSVLAGLGDVDRDGVPDFAIAAPAFDGAGIDRGRIYVLRGASAFASRPLAEIAAGDGGLAIDGEADYDAAGASVAGVGDVDGDGDDDFAIAAPGHGDARGRVYVITGGFRDAIDLAAVAVGDGGFAIDGEQLGDSVARVGGAGDLDGDGTGDLLVGAFQAGEGGRAYVVYGGALDQVALTDVARGDGGFAITGAPGELTGRALAGGGDLDGDGTPDLLLGSVGADDRGAYSGRVDRIDGDAAVCP